MAYELTEKRLTAARANLKKAWQAHCAGRVPRPERPPNLKHSFFALDLRRSVILLGEDVREYDAHVDRFVKALEPTTDRERRIVVRIAEAAWRLLRGYRARGHAQARKLRQLLEVGAQIDLNGTKALAFCVVENFEDDRCMLAQVRYWQEQLRWLFGRLFIERTGNDQGFRLESAAKSKKWDKRAGFDEGLGDGG